MSTLSKLVGLKQLKRKKDQSYDTEIKVQTILKAVEQHNICKKDQLLNISENQFITLCRLGRSVLLSQPSLLRLSIPMIVATGTLGYYQDLSQIFSKCGPPNKENYLFLGDYVGKGNKSIECLVCLICFKLKYSQNFFLLRGCSDSIALTRGSKFYEECVNRFSPKAWTQACEFLCSLPFAAVIQNQIFCVHGGLSPQLYSLDEINKVTRPVETPEVGFLCDLLWSDPSIKQDSLMWAKNVRGFGYCFHQKVITQFVRDNSLSMICRAHEVVYNGFQLNTQKNFATICSLADYCGLYSNSAGVMVVDSQMTIFFRIVKERARYPVDSNLQNSPNAMLNRIIQQKQRQKKQREEQQKQLQRQQHKKEQKIKEEQEEKQLQQLQQAQLRRSEEEDEPIDRGVMPSDERDIMVPISQYGLAPIMEPRYEDECSEDEKF